jgi:hypothetical protein
MADVAAWRWLGACVHPQLPTLSQLPASPRVSTVGIVRPTTSGSRREAFILTARCAATSWPLALSFERRRAPAERSASLQIAGRLRCPDRTVDSQCAQSWHL